MLAMSLSAGWASNAFAAEQEDLRDLAARVQFNAYAADVRALRADIAALTQLQVGDDLVATRQYFVGYGQWKLAETLLEKDRGGAKRAAEQCQLALEPIIDAQAPRSNAMPRAQRERWFERRAEALAISAGCKWSGAEASLLPGSNMLGSMKVDDTLEEAAIIARRSRAKIDRDYRSFRCIAAQRTRCRRLGICGSAGVPRSIVLGDRQSDRSA
jgi:hypothetical protein